MFYMFKYNERLNDATEKSKTPHIHWVVRVKCDREDRGCGEGVVCMCV